MCVCLLFVGSGRVLFLRPCARYLHALKGREGTPEGLAAIASTFPFTRYFASAPQPLFQGVSFAADLEVAHSCMRHINHMFQELREFRPFELMHKGRDRSKYLLTKEATVVAMTCTHAALTRRELVALSFKYDNVLMEEAAQILEIETFVPLLLQNPEDGVNRLKRVVLIGDHHQLPPVIKNMAFKQYSNMEQSMFARFIRLGVPHIQLDAQGRARPSIAELYSWNYEGLGSLPHTSSLPEFTTATAGLRYEYQLIDVGDFNGQGEHSPEPYFYQNLAEAEYIVALFMYVYLPFSRCVMVCTCGSSRVTPSTGTCVCRGTPRTGSRC